MSDTHPIKIQKLDRKSRDRAKMLYFGDYELFDIAEMMNVDLDTVRFYVFGEDGTGSNQHCWYQIKKQLNPASVSTFIKDKIDVLDKTAGTALNIVNENLRRIQNLMLADDSYVLTIDDTKKLAGIVVDMDKIVRLESGKATDIIDNIAHMSIADARRLLAEDPFAPQVVEAEFDELEDTNEEKPSDNAIETSKELKQMEKPW